MRLKVRDAFCFVLIRPTHSVLRHSLLCTVGVGHIALFTSLSFSHTRTHSQFLPTSSIITPPSILDTAESRCREPAPDARSRSHMRHLSGPAPSPCCSLSSTYTSLAGVTALGFSGLWWEGMKRYLKPKKAVFICGRESQLGTNTLPGKLLYL